MPLLLSTIPGQLRVTGSGPNQGTSQARKFLWREAQGSPNGWGRLQSACLGGALREGLPEEVAFSCILSQGTLKGEIL